MFSGEKANNVELFRNYLLGKNEDISIIYVYNNKCFF